MLAGHFPAQAQETNSPSETQATDSSAETQVADSSPGALKKLSLEQLMDLDVTSVSKQPEPYAQAPAAIDVITNDEIRRSGVSSLPEALRLADNLDVAQSSSSTWNISARGFNAGNANKLLVLIDGRSVYTPLDSGVFWNAQDTLLADVDRIEVVSGPGGTLWGANAVNGVININTKSAKDTQGLYLETGGGTMLEDFAGVRYGGTLDSNLYFRVYGKYFDRGAEVLANGNSASDPWQMGQGGFRIDDEASAKDNFTLQGDLYGSPVSLSSGVADDYSGGNILGRWSHAFSDDSNMSLQMYYDRTHEVLPFPASTSGPITYAAGSFIDSLDTYDLDFQHHFSLDGSNRLTWGLGYRRTLDVVQNSPLLAFLPPILDHRLFSGFAQDEIALAEKWKLTLGSKLENNDYTGFEYEPSARLAWTPAERQLVWAAVSRAVRMPSRIDRDTFIPGSPPYFLTGSSAFISETVIAYELGYRAQLTPEVATSISAFFNNYDNLRGYGPSPGTVLPYLISNSLAAQTWGAEFTADDQMLDGWRLHLGYDLLQENIWVKPGQADLNNAQGDTEDPRNQVFLRSSMDLPGNLELDADSRWVDSLQALGGIVPSYIELDARLGWRPTQGLELSIVGQNLLQDHHLEYGVPSPTSEEIARSVYGKATCQF